MRTVSACALAKRPPRLIAATVAAEPFSSDRREVVLARDVTARVITRSSRVLPLLRAGFCCAISVGERLGKSTPTLPQRHSTFVQRPLKCRTCHPRRRHEQAQ